MKINLPEAFLDRMKRQIPEDFHDFIEALNTTPPISIRINPRKFIQIGPDFTKCPWEDNGFYLPTRPYFTHDPDFQAGAYYVQEASSMLIGHIVKQIVSDEWNLVIDLCAAPGGKTTQLLSKLPSSTLVLANEVVSSRLGALRHNLIKWGYTNVAVTSYNTENIALSGLKADLILVDAPCSGEGMFRKDTESILHWNEKNLSICELRQKEILKNLPNLNNTGGFLIYSTCTYNPGENMEQVKALVNRGYYTSIQVDINQNWGLEALEEEGIYGYQCLPHRVKGEGFFFSVLQRTDLPLKDVKEISFKVNSPYKKVDSQILKYLPENLSHYENQLIMDESNTIYINPDPDSLITPYLKIKPLFELGCIKGKEFIPSHPLAMVKKFDKNYPRIELPPEQAILYLKKQNFTIKECKTKGWHIVTFHGNPLGFIKILENRINNYLPNNMRILK
ncbi:MAG: hypothetical protein J5I59_08990 [Saprospiraceae bacterium]|nr:hypothetical protein [Saprospiraceae bacterium]